jgi:hypothetical protein
VFRIDFDGRDVNYGFGELDVSPVGCVMGPDPHREGAAGEGEPAGIL